MAAGLGGRGQRRGLTGRGEGGSRRRVACAVMRVPDSTMGRQLGVGMWCSGRPCTEHCSACVTAHLHVREQEHGRACSILTGVRSQAAVLSVLSVR